MSQKWSVRSFGRVFVIADHALLESHQGQTLVEHSTVENTLRWAHGAVHGFALSLSIFDRPRRGMRQNLQEGPFDRMRDMLYESPYCASHLLANQQLYSAMITQSV